MILRMIATGVCQSRIELSRQTGLSKMSVSNIITEFMEQGIVEETKAQQIKGQGRNPITLRIAKNAPKIIGLAIHRDECVAILSDLQLQIIKKASIRVDHKISARLLNEICSLIDQVMPRDDMVLGIGVGSLGPVDVNRGMILNPPNFFGIRDLEITSFLKERYQLPVYLESQYNCAALAEKFFGIGNEYQDFVFVGIMNGIGSGIIADGKVLHSASGLTSEIGHVSVDSTGHLCNCGNRGCLETYAGTRAVETKLRQITGQDLNFRQFCQIAARHNEKELDKVFHDMMDQLACALTSTVNLLNSQAIIIGHEGYFIPDRYIDYLEERMNKQKLSGDYWHIVVKKSFFKNETHLRGCSCSILNHIFKLM